MNSEAEKGFVSNFLTNRAWLAGILLAAVLLDLGVHFLASAVPELANLSHPVVLLLGLVLILVSLLILSRRTFKRRKYDRKIDGFITFSKSKQNLQEARHYQYSERIVSYLQAAFSENSALETLWKQATLLDQFKVDQATGKMKKKEVPASRLVVEATEYFVLSRLSTTLTDYFNRMPDAEKMIVSLERNDVPDVLLENRIFELLSRPMDQRPAFVQDSLRPQSSHIIMAAKGKGQIYERFDLVLPRKATLQRMGPGEIKIDTRLFSIVMKVSFGGTHTVVPYRFAKVYMEEPSPNDFSHFEIGLSIQVKFRMYSLLTFKGWRYHEWLDKFVDTLEIEMSKERFLDDINWKTIETILICQMVMEKSASQPSPSRRTEDDEAMRPGDKDRPQGNPNG